MEKSPIITTPIRIVFMGTPEFAVASLDALLRSGADVAAVVTAPDRPSGRGQRIQTSPVKDFAVRHHIPVLQPDKLRDPEFVEVLRGIGADLFVVVAFRMLPEVIWSMPPKGTINLHGSLLPAYRGAAPIQRAIMDGATETGVTTFFLEKDIDTGRIIAQRKMSIGPDETAGSLHDRMKVAGAECLVDTVARIANGTVTSIPQSETGAPVSHAPKIFREDCRVDWSWPLDRVHNHIRGLSPSPGAWTTAGGNTLKILSGHKGERSPSLKQGLLESDGRNHIRFACSDGWYYADIVQLEGRKAMPTEELLRGWRPEQIP